MYGRDSLETMEQWVQAKFSHVPNKDLPVHRVPTEVFAKDGLARLLEVVPVKDVKALDLYFPMPAVEHLYRSKPGRYLAHLIGHESEGSILEALKKHNLANGLSASTSHSYLDFSFFSINIELTDDGLKRVNDVVACVFAYFGVLRREEVKPWIYKELQGISDLKFRFQEKSEPSRYVTALANNMQIYPPQHIITGSKLIFDLDSASVTPLLETLTPDQALVFVKHQGLKGFTTEVEPHYKTEYNMKTFSAEQKQLWKSSMDGSHPLWTQELVHLPKPNPFVPTDFTLRCVKKTSASVATDGNKVVESEEDLDALLREPPSMIQKKTTVPSDTILAEDSMSMKTDAIPNLMSTKSAWADSSPFKSVGGDVLTWRDCYGRSSLQGDEEDDEERATSDRDTAEDLEDALPSLHGTSLLTWFKMDQFWKVPKLNVVVSLESPLVSTSPVSVVLADLLSSCLKDILSGYSYYADCAGLHYDVKLAKGGLELVFNGWADKLPVLVEKTLDELKKMGTVGPCQEDIFTRIKEKLRRGYQNYVFNQPYFHCILGTLCCLEEPRWSSTERYFAIKSVSNDDLFRFTAQFLRNLKVEVMVHGNANNKETRALTKLVRNKLQSDPLPLSQTPVKRMVRLEKGTEYLYRQYARDLHPVEVNSAVENLYWVGEVEGASEEGVVNIASTKLRNEALLSLVSHLLQEPAFDQLRTKEQLGYIVHTAVKKVSNQLALHIIVQSGHKGPDYLDDRIEEFLFAYYHDKLLLMAEEEFNTNIQAVIENFLERPKNLDEESGSLWDEIVAGTYLFPRKQLLADVLRTTDLPSVITFFETHIFDTSSRRKFSSQYVGTGATATADATTTDTYVDGVKDESEKRESEEEVSEVPISTEEPTRRRPILSASEGPKKVYIWNHATFKKSMPLLPVSPSIAVDFSG